LLHEKVIAEIKYWIERLKPAYARYRLLLLVGQSGSGKTYVLRTLSAQKHYPYLNLNLLLSKALLKIPLVRRPRELPKILQDILAKVTEDVVLLDNTELLFEPSLYQDPLRLLENLSKNKTIIASWHGDFDGTTLTYAEPGHAEWKKYQEVNAVVIPLNKFSQE